MNHFTNNAPQRAELILLLVLLLLTACALEPEGPRRPSPENEPTLVPTSVVSARPTYEVQRGTVTHQLQFHGRVAPVTESNIAFPIEGRVLAVHVTVDEMVSTGDLLAELDTAELEADLEIARSELEIARARLEAVEDQVAAERREAEINLNIAQLNLEYAEAQAGDEPTLDQRHEIDLRTYQVELAQLALERLNNSIDPTLQSDVDQATLRVEQLTSTIANAALVAPMDGQIISLNLSPGQTVQAEEPVGVVADVSRLRVTAFLGPDQLEQLAESMPVTITPARRPEQVMMGTIRRLPYPYGSGGNQEQFRDADAAVWIGLDAQAQSMLSSGDLVNVAVALSERENALWLPHAAIRNFNGRRFVVIQDGALQRRVDITLGIEGEGRIEIIDGVEEGQIVIGP